MLSSFTLKDFKSYREATLPLSPLTLLIGANASGKSNLIEALRLLSCAAWRLPVRLALWIPALERVKKLKSPTTLRHSRESGNLLAASPQEKPGRYCGRRLRIPAFAGMTKYYSVGIVPYDADTSAIHPSR